MGLGGQILGTAASLFSARKARKNRSRAAAIARRRERYQTRVANLQNIEEYRARVGQLVNIAAQTGNLDGSAAMGIEGSLLTQAAANITFNQQLQTFAEAEGRRLERAQLNDFQSQAWSSFAQLSESVGKSLGLPGS